jgi:hypothetical protein
MRSLLSLFLILLVALAVSTFVTGQAQRAKGLETYKARN